MGTTAMRAAYENALGGVSQALSRAIERAEALNDEGAVEDLTDTRRHVVAMMSESLGNKRHRRAELDGQLSLP